ncbi:DMT family transporter [Limnochorda pilosa]|uniref:Antibiotic transporter n=1 Tax=Limnochorda pilosa TaxID=1555112 RepID=A0A0K2SL55_LIMPI|nr:DMT family transporter [Limnochorda pilosa]BAS27727.1 antibiotic transporter [Limnochorda pilosa]
MSVLSRALPFLALAGAALLWAGNYTVSRALVTNISPLVLGLARWALGFPVLLALSLRTFDAPSTGAALRQFGVEFRDGWRRWFWIGLTGMAVYSTLIYEALQYTGAVTGSLFNSLTPAVISVMAFVWLGERLSRAQWGGFWISLAGVLVILSRGRWDRLAALQFNAGDLIMTVNVFFWAAYSILVRQVGLSVPALRVAAHGSLMACLLLAPLLLVERIGWGHEMEWTSWQVAGLLFLGLGPAASATTLWNYGLVQVGASRASVFLHAIPLFTAVLTVAGLGEPLAWFQMTGGLLVVAGVLLTSLLRSPASVPTRDPVSDPTAEPRRG